MRRVAAITVRRGRNGALAQLGEHWPCKPGVEGSSPLRSTRKGGAERASVAAVDVLRQRSSGAERRTENPCVGGSNPPAGTVKVLRRFRLPAFERVLFAGVAQRLEHSADNREVEGPNPSPGTVLRGRCRIRRPGVAVGRGEVFARVAQLAEQRPCKPMVAGSNPVPGSVMKMTETTTTTGFGRVPKWPNGAGCRPAGLRAFGGSSPPSPTGTTAGGYYSGEYERMVELVQAPVCKTGYVGSNPTALSGRNEPRECCSGAMVQRNGHRTVDPETRVRLPLAPPPEMVVEDTSAALGQNAGVAQVAEHGVANAKSTGSNPVSRSARRSGGCGTLARRGWAGVAQLVEHQPSKLDVAGSMPVSRSISSSVSSVG